MTGEVRGIFIAPRFDAGIIAVQRVEAVPGQGLVGDRYFQEPRLMPDQEITLIESEQIEQINRESGLEIAASDCRRNILTVGVHLNDLAGRRFAVGEVQLQGVKLCEPCRYLGESLVGRSTRAEIVRLFAHRGGLRCQILTRGSIGVGDPVIIHHKN